MHCTLDQIGLLFGGLFGLTCYMFQESEDCLSPDYHFVTAGGGGNIPGSNVNYVCIVNKIFGK